MTAHSIKTDNASVANKVFLRQKATEGLASLKVLDLYAGNNVLWKHFITERYYGVEIIKNKGENLCGDCRRVIDSLDLSDFNVIDCDSYGIPFDVLVHIFENKTLKKGTVIVYTAISNKMSGINKQCLRMFHLESIYKKSRSLLSAKALDFFYAMLESFGVETVYYYRIRQNFEKHYGYFSIS